MQYQDLKGLDYMTRVITETLRLWPAVANGTFRKTAFEDTIKGPKGSNVRLPKGSFCVIPNWSRHRSKELWGEDANEFNPERRFTDGELYFTLQHTFTDSEMMLTFLQHLAVAVLPHARGRQAPGPRSPRASTVQTHRD